MKESFKTVATFQYSSEAQIIKGRLEADGIEVFIVDNYTIDTDPLVSNAIGGVKLKVHAENEVMAKEILASIAAYSMDDEGEPMVCPNCQSTKIHFMTHVTDFKSLASFIVSFIFGVLPFYTKYDHRCEDCKHKF
ncbi:DUF2007 domain-containing protein [Dokdonia sp.]|uniref:putative signal transducing protein n=1 Tax=Dokdonia sp. TaxID=2024995 RepID=UPI0032647241